MRAKEDWELWLESYSGRAALMIIVGVVAFPVVAFVGVMLGAKKIGFPIWIGIPLGFAAMIGSVMGVWAIVTYIPFMRNITNNFWMMGGGVILIILSGITFDYDMDYLSTSFCPLWKKIICGITYGPGLLLIGIGFLAFIKNIYT